MELIPAIDLRAGEVVRLTQGDDARRTRYGLDPRVVVRDLASAGIGRIHVVDLDGAFGESPQRDLIAELAALGAELGVELELGGGLRDGDAVRWALDQAACGRIVLGSLAVREFDTFAELVAAHPQRIVPAVEVAAGALKVAGWRESAPVGLEDFCGRLVGLVCPAVLVTDVERDGTLAGPNLDLARRVHELSGLPALLSGGVRSLDDLRAAAAVPGIAGAIVGKALYDGVFTVAEARRAAEGGE